MSAHVTTAKLHAALAKRYNAPEWGLIHEVSNSTGYASKRHADAIAMSLWPSRGLLLHGFEVKATRGDFLRELRAPEKSAPVQKYCDRWWIVAEKGVVEDGELPATWGLLVRYGARLICKREAPELKPEALDRPFLAALFRRLSEAQINWIPKGKISEELAEARKEAVEDHKRLNAHHENSAAKEAKRIRERIAAFESASGVEIDRWRYGDIGQAVKTVLGPGVEVYQRNLKQLQAQAQNIADVIGQRLDGGE